MKKQSIFVTLALISGFFLILGQAIAGPTHPTFGTFVNASGVPNGSLLILNIVYKVTNDEDSGNVGYWSLANYNKQVQVWETPDESFYIIARYEGRWETFEGALSPGLGSEQPADAKGTFEGGYTATFTGEFSPGENKTKGNIGAFNLGGTKDDILDGTYVNQTGITAPFNFLSVYFTGYANFTYINWGWKYTYRNQTWNNFDYATTGDILVE